MSIEKTLDDPKFEDPLEATKREAREKYGEKEELKEGDRQLGEFVEAMEDSTKAEKYALELEEEKEKASDSRDTQVQDILDTQKGSYSSYRLNLAEWGMFQIQKFMEIPYGWDYHCVPTSNGSLDIYGKIFNTKDGILLVLKSPAHQVFIKAMHCAYNPKVDMGALSTLLLYMENTIDHHTGRLEETKVKTKKDPFIVVDEFGKERPLT